MIQNSDKLFSMNYKLQFSRGFARFSIFVVFVWFGVLKVLGLSPATPLVMALFDQMITYLPDSINLSFEMFNVYFGAFEVLIGLLFIMPPFTKFAALIFVPHLIATTLPLVLLTEHTWTSSGVPTLEGQYIVKNLLLVSAVIYILEGYRKPFYQQEVTWKPIYGNIKKNSNPNKAV